MLWGLCSLSRASFRQLFRESTMGMSGCLCWFSACRVWWEVCMSAVVTTQRENYYKTKEWTKKKKRGRASQGRHAGERGSFSCRDITLHVIEWCRAKPDEFGATWEIRQQYTQVFNQHTVTEVWKEPSVVHGAQPLASWKSLTAPSRPSSKGGPGVRTASKEVSWQLLHCPALTNTKCGVVLLNSGKWQ